MPVVSHFVKREKMIKNKLGIAVLLIIISVLVGFIDGIYYNFVFLPKYYGSMGKALTQIMTTDSVGAYIKSPLGLGLTLLCLIPALFAIILLLLPEKDTDE